MRAYVAVTILLLACCSFVVGACIDGTTPNCDAGAGCEPTLSEASAPDTSVVDSGKDSSPDQATPDTSIADAPSG